MTISLKDQHKSTTSNKGVFGWKEGKYFFFDRLKIFHKFYNKWW